MHLKPVGDPEIWEDEFNWNSNQLPWVLIEFNVVGEFSPSPKKRSNRRYDQNIEVEIEERPKTGFLRAKSIGVWNTPGDEVSVKS